MNPLFSSKQTTPVFLVPLLLACFVLSPRAHAVSPPPDGGYPGNNTAEGQNALFSLTTGTNNTANGKRALYSNTSGNNNTAVGTAALFSNIAPNNTAVGTFALLSNLGDPDPNNFSGVFNNAVGANAMRFNVDGISNNAVGESALRNNIHGVLNTAIGDLALTNNDVTGNSLGNVNTAVGAGALFSNTDGDSNNAVGADALGSNATGSFNQAMGAFAMESNQDGAGNVAIGDSAFFNNVSGSFNTVIGFNAGGGVEGDENIYLGATVTLPSGGSESGTIRIGDPTFVSACYIAGIVGQTATGGSQVFIDANGKLGTLTSSIRFKEHVRPMDKASETLFALQPVTFCYKKDIDAKGTPQFGLVAEEVAKVNPNLVINDRDGKPYTVRYEAVNAMLLNEFLKAHRTMKQQEAMIERQQEQIDALTKGLQKVNAQLEASKPAPQVVNNP
ncbi:MAG TPA: tail fiber domain-containing protein [Pyrinomonadaceae bacterium]|jgi:trimeric autotransporter adhesin